MNKITQRSIAKKADISESYLSMILCGHRRPHWQNAKKLSKATNTKPELWLEGSPETIRKVLNAVNF